jgi:hypothetical protein
MTEQDAQIQGTGEQRTVRRLPGGIELWYARLAYAIAIGAIVNIATGILWIGNIVAASLFLISSFLVYFTRD